MNINAFYWKWKRALRRNRDVINRCISISLTVLLLAFFAYIGFTIYKSDKVRMEIANRPPDENKIVIDKNWDYGEPGYHKVAENDRIILEADYTTAYIRLTDKESGKQWYSNPTIEKDSYAPTMPPLRAQLHLTALEPSSYGVVNMNSSADSVKKGGLSYELIEGGIKFIFKFPKANLIIPVQYTLCEDGFQAEIVSKEIVSVGDKAYLLSTIDLLPYFGAGGLNDDGYLFVPDGSGAIIEYNNQKQKYQRYVGMVYGTNPTIAKTKETAFSERVSLPVFGSKCNDSAFLGVILSGDANSQIIASTSRKTSSYNTVFASGMFLDYSRSLLKGNYVAKDTVLFEKAEDLLQGQNYAVRYYFLNGEDANYTGMANRYKQHLEETNQLKATKLAEEKYLVLDLVGAVSIEKYVFGIKMPVITPLTTYNDVCTIVQELKASGVEKLIINYVGALDSGLNNVMFTGVEPETKLGTKKEFQHMIEYLASEGVELFIETNPVDLHSNGNGYRATVVGAKSFYDAYAFQYKYALDHLGTIDGSRWHMLMPQLVPKFVDNYLGTMSKWNVENISIDRLGSILYTHYPNNGEEQITRIETMKLWQEAMKNASEHSGYVMIHGGNAYAAGYADVITDVSDCDSYYDMEDYSIPFYQMVFQGDRVLTPYGINTTVDYDLAVLKLLETGMSLKFNLIYGDIAALVGTEYNTMVSYSYEFWKDIIIEKYNLMQDVMSEFKGQEITWHESLAEDVSLTVYETGKVVVNYSDEPYAYRGIMVQPRTYLVLPGGTK